MKKNLLFILIFFLCILKDTLGQSNINYLVAINLRTNITSSNPNPDPVQTVINFNPNSTEGYDQLYDAIFFGGQGANIFSYIGNQAISINNFGPFTSDKIIRLGVTCPTNPGACRISASDNLDYIGTSNLVLEDTLLNVFHDLRANPDYNVTLVQGSYTNRFKLHLSPSATANYLSNCFESALILNNYSSLPVSYSISDNNSNIIGSGEELASNSINFPVAVGEYYVTFTRGVYSYIDTVQVITSNFSLDGVISSSTNIVDVSDSIDISFDLNISGQADSIIWDFGDGDSLYNLLSVSHFFNTEGEYNVTATIFNDSCSLVLEIPIIVSNTTSIVAQNNKNIDLVLLENKFLEISNVYNNQNVQIEFYSIDGKLINSENKTLMQNVRNTFPLNKNLNTGMYIAKVKASNFEINKKIMVTNN
jgi:hypothetical protein